MGYYVFLIFFFVNVYGCEDDYDLSFLLEFESFQQDDICNDTDQNSLHRAAISNDYQKAKAFITIPGNNKCLHQKDIYGKLPVYYAETAKMKDFFKTAYVYDEVIDKFSNSSSEKVK